jgi:hypothetical protein
LQTNVQWRFSLAYASGFLLCLASVVGAVEPSLRTLNIRGLQIGGTTEITCDGDDLTTSPRLLLPFAAQQQLKEGATEKKATFAVTLGNEVEPGYYQLRIATSGGVTLPVVIGVDRLSQIVAPKLIEQLPVAVHGTVSGSTATETRFKGKQGEAVTIEIEAQRMGSKLRPVIHLLDPKGKQLAWTWPKPELFGDARLEATLPNDGEYVITCHDLEYAAPNPSFYRLRIGKWTRVEQAFPAVIAVGEQRPVELLTSNGPIQQTAGPAEGPVAKLQPPSPDFSGPRPFLRLSSNRELLEETAAAGEQSLAAGPLGISGKLNEPNQEDRYKLAVNAGDKLRLEVFAQRYGSPIDLALVIRNEQGGEVARGEDSPGSVDPLLDYTVPEKITSLQICVADSQGRGGPLAAYHLNVRNQESSAADFRLLTNLERAAIPKGGRWILPVWLDRRGYQGPVELSATGLPAGLSITGNNIHAGSGGALVTVTADDAEPAADQLASITQWQGKTVEGKQKSIIVKNHELETLQPWLAEEIALSRVNSPAADFTIDWRDLPESAALQPTAKLALPIRLTRVEDKTAVRLSLLTNQLVTLVNNQPDPKTTIRVEKAVELGAKQNEGELSLPVPAELVNDSYEIAVQAELLSADKQKVLATAFTPIRRLPVQLPVEVQLAGEPKIDVMLDPAKGTMQKIEGTIKRREGITGDVVVSLTGLPAGLKADTPTVKADATNFTVTVTLPPTQPAGDLAGLKLSATIAPDPKQPNVRVKSRDVEFKLNVVRTMP